MAGLAFFVMVIFYIIAPKEADLAKIRNAKRKTDLESIVIAIHQYAADNGGDFPLGLSNKSKEICKNLTNSCSGMLDLSILSINNYLQSVPYDPLAKEGNASGYIVNINQFNRVVSSSKFAEGQEKIIIIR